MKKEITLGQMITASLALLTTIITAWITMNNKVTALETKMQVKETEEYNYRLSLEKKMEKMDSKIDDINQKSTDILIQLQNKANRK